jgi:hypothetical protein
MERTMKLPGFTAQATLAGSGRHRRGRVMEMQAEAGMVVPASHWGEFKADHCRKMSDCNPDGSCVGNGLRQFSAILWDIPWGRSWEAECNETPPPAVINGVTFTKPSRCVNTGFNMWGEFDVPDSTCPCGTAYPICLQNPSSCQDSSIIACSQQLAQMGCWSLPGCRFISWCQPSGRCTTSSFP